jgi:hypothetical protein
VTGMATSIGAMCCCAVERDGPDAGIDRCGSTVCLTLPETRS